MALTTRPAFTIVAELAPPIEVGKTPTGFLRVIPIIGGQVSDGLDGVVLPGGADWNMVLPDGSARISAKYELRLDDGSVVSVANVATVPSGGEPPILTSPTFEVGAGGPTWLRSGVFVGVLLPGPAPDAVRIEVHEVRAALRG